MTTSTRSGSGRRFEPDKRCRPSSPVRRPCRGATALARSSSRQPSRVPSGYRFRLRRPRLLWRGWLDGTPPFRRSRRPGGARRRRGHRRVRDLRRARRAPGAARPRGGRGRRARSASAAVPAGTCVARDRVRGEGAAQASPLTSAATSLPSSASNTSQIQSSAPPSRRTRCASLTSSVVSRASGKSHTAMPTTSRSIRRFKARHRRAKRIRATTRPSACRPRVTSHRARHAAGPGVASEVRCATSSPS